MIRAPLDDLATQRAWDEQRERVRRAQKGFREQEQKRLRDFTARQLARELRPQQNARVRR